MKMQFYISSVRLGKIIGIHQIVSLDDLHRLIFFSLLEKTILLKNKKKYELLS